MDAKTTEQATAPLRAGYNSLVPDTELRVDSLLVAVELPAPHKKPSLRIWQHVYRLFVR